MKTTKNPIFMINTRILSGHTTGVQRYLIEVLVRTVHYYACPNVPQSMLNGIPAHVWEQGKKAD